MSEASTKLDLGFNECVAILIERDEQDLLHLDRQLPEGLQRRRGDMTEHLRAQDLKDLVVHDRVRLGHETRNRGRVRDLAVVPPECRPEGADRHLELIKAEVTDAVEQRVEVVLEPGPELARRDAVRGGRARADRLLDAREVRDLPDGYHRRLRARCARGHKAARGEHARCDRRGRMAQRARRLLRGRPTAADGRVAGVSRALLRRLSLRVREQARRRRCLLGGDVGAKGRSVEHQRVALRGRLGHGCVTLVAIILLIGPVTLASSLGSASGVDRVLGGVVVRLADIVLQKLGFSRSGRTDTAICESVA
jgi:hypothetical protein